MATLRPYVRKAMKKNVFKFRRLKWGDPEEKFKLLPEDTTPSDGGRTRERGGAVWSDKTLIAAALVLIVLALGLSL
ncbi:hypothetical protein [Pelagibacterium xiamenense]|uniref:hypothetical protein n=1 Tax=Pelagibacterium xiamenense TaxID=2901140 RepID=UPI001E42C827|nr:hypothetical protein [Pelagibacterium xiamenense]MCD7059759.1 hypothetical protein [Pelagibacterium xiamenense]